MSILRLANLTLIPKGECFCKCLNDTAKLKKLLNTKEEISLMLGVGYGDKTKHRREDHMTKEIVESFNKDNQIKIFNHA